MKLDFYYWGAMCPLNDIMINLLNQYHDRIDIHLHDITNQPDIARNMQIYFPTLTVVDDTHRYFNPIRPAFLDELCNQRYPEELPYRPTHGKKEYHSDIIPITAKNYGIAGCCTGMTCSNGCIKKIESLESSQEIFGFMNVKDGQLLGGAEYVPSNMVPYPIPKDSETAFLTCIYNTDVEYDFKSAPLQALEEYLKNIYKTILVITDENGTFPNGDLEFFRRNYYEDQGIIRKEGDYCTLHLMKKLI